MVRFGSGVIGMPPVLIYRGSDAALMIYYGVTRATRVARLLPRRTVRVEVMRTIARPVGHLAHHRGHTPMTSKELRRDILRALAELFEHTPDVRFGQLIANLAVIARGPTPEAIWDVEDDELLDAARAHTGDYHSRRAVATPGALVGTGSPPVDMDSRRL